MDNTNHNKNNKKETIDDQKKSKKRKYDDMIDDDDCIKDYRMQQTFDLLSFFFSLLLIYDFFS